MYQQQQNSINEIVNKINTLKNAINALGTPQTQEQQIVYESIVRQHNELVDRYDALTQQNNNRIQNNQYVYNNNNNQVQYRQPNALYQQQVTPIQQQEVYTGRYRNNNSSVTVEQVKEPKSQQETKKVFLEGHEFPLLCSNDRKEVTSKSGLGYKREVELRGDRPLAYNDYTINVDTIELDNINHLYRETTEEKVYNILYTEDVYSPVSISKFDIEDIDTMVMYIHNIDNKYPMFSDYINTKILPIFNMLMDGKYKLGLTATNLSEDIKEIIEYCGKIRLVEKKENAYVVLSIITSIISNLKVEGNKITSRDYILGIIDSELHSVIKKLNKEMYSVTKHSYPTIFKLLEKVFQDDSVTYKTIVVYGDTKAIEVLVTKDIFGNYIISLV